MVLLRVNMTFLVLCVANSGGESGGDVPAVDDGDRYNLFIGTAFPSPT